MKQVAGHYQTMVVVPSQVVHQLVDPYPGIRLGVGSLELRLVELPFRGLVGRRVDRVVEGMACRDAMLGLISIGLRSDNYW